MVILLIFYAIMAGVYTFGKQVLLYASPFFLTGVRITFGGLCFLGYQFLVNRKQFYIKKNCYILLICFAISIFLMDSFRLLSLQYIPSAHGAIIATSAPFIAAVLSWWWFKEQFNIKKVSALIIGVLGVFPLLLSHISLSENGLLSTIVAYSMMFISTCAFVVCGLLSKTIIQKRGMPFFMTIGTVMTSGGLLGFLFSFLFEQWTPIPVVEMLPALKLIFFLIATHSLIAYPLYNYLVQKYHITFVAFAQLTVPLFTAFFSKIFFKQVIGAPFLISLVTLSVAFAVFYHEELHTRLQRQRQ